MEARSFTVASILILMAIASSEGAAPVEQKIAPIAPVSKSASIYQSHYEAPIETSGEEIEDGADDVFDMLLQVEAAPAKKKAAAMAAPKVQKAAPKVIEEKLAPASGAQGIYEEEYMAPPSGEETLDSMDSVFDAMVQVDATYEDSRPTPEGEEREDRKDHRGHFKSHKHMRHTKAVHHAKAKAKAATHKEGAEP